MIKLLKNNCQFRIFWIANTLSTAGDLIDDIAFAQIVYLVTQSTLLTGYVFAIKVILSFLSIIAATYVDRHSSKTILRVCNFGQAINLMCFIYLLCKNLLNMQVLMVFVTVQTIFSSVTSPASNSLIAYVVRKDELIDARASLSMIAQLLQVLAYAFAGVLISMTGIAGAMIIDTLTFIISGILIGGINELAEKESERNANKFWTDFGDGFNYVLKNTLIIGIIVISFLGNVAVAPIDSLMPAFFLQEKYETWTYSMFMAAIAIGSIMGAWFTSKFKNKISLYIMYTLGFFVGAIGFMCIFLNFNLAIIVGAVLIGISTGKISILTSTLLLYFTPKEKIARVFSIFKALTYVASPFGILCVGLLGEYIRVRMILPLLVIILLLASMFSYVVVKKGETFNEEKSGC